ncbi:hypothetical protein ElyMa_004243400 [Elysia marginata]|uniref:Reverse transcriptase domain-containing protein n=1 Tax=Elysia marginata TaxID=1093978 RepID=A0AAV4GUU4_9GAST|nr:hypothetical protein ElyMa_004243400 [Elysia marginata]
MDTKWLAAKTLQEKINITVTGIDMSAAFDTIDRATLLDILETIIEEDELRLVRFLLSNTCLNIRIGGTKDEKKFTRGLPVEYECDGSCGCLDEQVRFDVAGSRLSRKTFVHRSVLVKPLTDFVKGFGQVNKDGKCLIFISKEETEWRKTKKVGSLTGDTEDVERRKQLSNVALHKLKNVWISKDKIKRETKIKLYKSLVKSILIYNCGTWALTQTEANKLDTFHRKQLRNILDIHYPTLISNKSLYKICNETPLSVQIVESRWRLFGHILRRDNDIPTNRAMQAYFNTLTTKFRGRPSTTLPIILNKELSQAFPQMKLKTTKDLQNLQSLAQDRGNWKSLTGRITEFARASSSDAGSR